MRIVHAWKDAKEITYEYRIGHKREVQFTYRDPRKKLEND